MTEIKSQLQMKDDKVVKLQKDKEMLIQGHENKVKQLDAELLEKASQLKNRNDEVTELQKLIEQQKVKTRLYLRIF